MNLLHCRSLGQNTIIICWLFIWLTSETLEGGGAAHVLVYYSWQLTYMYLWQFRGCLFFSSTFDNSTSFCNLYLTYLWHFGGGRVPLV